MPRLGEVLVAHGSCTSEAVRVALAHQQTSRERIGTTLLRLGYVEESQLADALAVLHGIPAASGEVRPDAAAIACLGPRLAARYEAVPYRLSGRRLSVLVDRPIALDVHDELSFVTGKSITPVIVAEARLSELLWKHYGLKRGTFFASAAPSRLPSAARRTMRIAIRPGGT